MNKTTESFWALGIFVVLLVIAGIALVGVTRQVAPGFLGNSTTDINYNNVTRASVNCHGDTGGKVLAATSTGRTSFVAINNSTNTVQLCKDGTCSATTGISLTTSSQPGSSYEQTDGYTGPWSCFSTVGTSTVYVWSSQ